MARDSANPSSGSTWGTLPKDIQLYILGFMQFASIESIGKTPQQIYRCIQFIFTHLAEFNESLQTAVTTHQAFNVMEKKGVKEVSQFRFFPAKPLLLASASQLSQQGISEPPDTIKK